MTIEAARRYAFKAALGYLCARGTPVEVARDQAEDAAQEGLRRVLARGLSRYASERHLRNAVARIAINWTTSEYRRKKAARLGEHDPTDPNSLLDADTAKEEHLDLLREAMTKLGAADRHLVELKYTRNLTLEEIADELGSTINKVWYRLNAIRDQLRREIERLM